MNFISVYIGYQIIDNHIACDVLNLSTLAEWRLSICSTLLRQITRESHVLHYLIPVKRDAEVAGRL